MWSDVVISNMCAYIKAGMLVYVNSACVHT